MIHNVDAIYDHGVLRPIGPLSLPEGARVRLRVEEENGSLPISSDYNRWLDNLSGRWQGDFACGGEGDLEKREPLS
jgi:predicted DNA-binding antitoxin AbrB/MazE fold protein